MLLHKKQDHKLHNFTVDKESTHYSGCSFELNEQSFLYRASKITPTKTGQFVTVWKRNANGKTIPFDISEIDWLIITCECGEWWGQFIFPKNILAEKGILSINKKGGKRGFRVYPIWDSPTNKQAQETQRWQLLYFKLVSDLPIGVSLPAVVSGLITESFLKVIESGIASEGG